jgi:2-polyprenyl-6-methoxyphenol hydroxylase-like FAD-dependent oxidoreductase
MRVFGEKMVLSALNLQDKDFHLLEILRDNYGQQFDVGTLQAMMRGEGWNITNSDVRSSLKSMKTKGYVRPDKSVTPHEWSASEFAKQVSREVNLDWPTLIEDTKEVVHDHYPKPVAMDYQQQFLEGDGLLVTHPFDGHTVNLAEEEANVLEEKVEEKQEEEAEAFQGSLT